MNDMVTHNMSNSLATLCNIGNSCYMNSVLYTLRFAPNFTHNLHHLVEFLELVLQKTSGDRQQKHGPNQPHALQHKPKSSSLGRNIPGVHGSSGRSWSSKDLASLGNVNGSESSAAGSFATPAAGAAGASGISSFGPYNNGIGGECGGGGGGGGGGAVNATSGCINTAGANSTAGSGSAYRNQRDGGGEPGTGGDVKSNRHVVCETLHELFHSLARNEAADVIEPFHAGGLLHAVQSVSATFEGNQQQDAHEFLMCILDSVRESCQTLNRKLLENPDLLRNSSFSMIGGPPAGGPSSQDTVDGTYASHAAPPAPETKPSSAPFISRNIFRRRKESLKNAKSALAKEGRTITVDGSVATVHPVSTTAPKAPLDASPSEGASSIINQTAVQKCGATDERLLQDRIRALGLNFFGEDFEGVTVSRTRCLTCETETKQKETMIDIAIPITSVEGPEAAKNPQQFYQDACITQEYFRGDNKYRCEVCSSYTEACRTISFDILPRLLVLQLKRFNGDMEKINSYIPTPFVLQCFCRDCLGKCESEKRHVYHLYSVITHVGARMSVGHYITYTSSLETPHQYYNCAKDRQRRVLLAAATLEAYQSGGASGKGHNGSEKSTSGQLKKLFSGKKASSAGDISKKLKNNVINRFSPSNGIEMLHLNGGNVGQLVGGTTGPPPAVGGSTLAQPALGSSEQLGGAAGLNLPGAPTGGSFPFPGGTGINGTTGGTAADAAAAAAAAGSSVKASGGCACPGSGCCGLLAKAGPATSANHSQHHQPFVHGAPAYGGSGSGRDGNSISMNDGASALRFGSFHTAPPHPAGSLGAPGLSAGCSNHLGGGFHDLNGTDGVTHNLGSCPGAAGAVAVTGGSNSAHTAPAAHRGFASEPNHPHQLMWYMCDDDKIKIMTQHEFEEMLSPNRRHVITPYLLFYARYDVQQQQQQQQPQQQPQQPQQQQKLHPSQLTKSSAKGGSTAANEPLLPESNSFNQFSQDGPVSSFIT